MTAPLRLLHVTRERGSDARYGIGKSLAPVVAALRAQGATVDIHDGAASDARLPTGWPALLGRLLRRWGRWRYAPPGPEQQAALGILAMVEERACIAWTAARQAVAEGYTHVHCHDPVLTWLFARFLPLVAWHGQRPRWGITEHGYGMFVQPRVGVPIPAPLLHLLQGWERWVVAQADWVCAPSHAGLLQLRHDLAARQGGESIAGTALPSHWHVVPHPRPPLLFPPRLEARQRLGIAADDWLLLGVGQLVPLKRWDVVLAAFARLPQDSGRRPVLLLLGEGEAAALRQQAAALGVADRLRLEVTDDIATYLAAADAYISASSTESFGMANCEALAAGLPAVCTAVGAVASVLGEGAWLIEDAPAAALETRLAQALAALLTDAALANRWRQAAVHWGQGWRDATAVALEMREIYSACREFSRPER